MTLVVHVGRRVPRAWFKRQANKVKGLITFQEHLWTMIKQSLSLAKRKANESGKITFVLTTDREDEDMNYQIEWLKVTIQGTPEQEKEEHEDTLKLYGPLNKVFKKDIPKDNNMSKHFKSKLLSPAKIDEAYKKGYGSIGEDNIANKMLEMGILTHIELIDDYDSRQIHINRDF